MTDYAALLTRMASGAATAGRSGEFGVALADALAQLMAQRSDAQVREFITLLRDRIHSIKVESQG